MTRNPGLLFALPALAALTVVGVLNRESALAIPLFLVLDPLVRARIARWR